MLDNHTLMIFFFVAIVAGLIVANLFGNKNT
jgi:hypothetical protein